jgi:protein arginine N-methyltransferase 1
MSRGHFVGLNYHRVMLTDPVRMEAYQRAIRAVVQPGDHVLDLGTGTGVLAFWAAQAGAECVWAVDPAPVIGVAERVGRANGFDAVRYVPTDSRALVLPRPVDVLVTECMGNFFVTDELQPVLRDAARHVRPGGSVVPHTISLHVAPAWLPTFQEVSFWEEEPGGIDFSAAVPFALNRTYVLRVEPEFLAAPPAELTRFPLLAAPDRIAAAVAFEVPAARTVHGFVGWFAAELAPGIVLDTRPGVRTHWGQLLFPTAPFPVAAGDRVSLRLELTLDERYESAFRWSGAVTRAGETRQRFAHDTSARFADADPARGARR